MVDSIDQRLLDTNAVLLGSGVGLAALEAMFNLVQTQSSLGAAMVKNNNASCNAALLAQTLEAVLNTGAQKCASAPHLEKIVSMLKDKSATAGTFSQTQTCPPPSMDQHSNELMMMWCEQLANMLQNSKPELAVT